jgi:low affinity Fe/Cu permease
MLLYLSNNSSVLQPGDRMKVTKSTSWFSSFSKWISHATGSALAFGLAIGTILAWAVTGPLFGFSDTWQLIINTGTTIVTFLMVFLIQNTQNRDGAAIQIKLDELIRCTSGAHNALLNLEELEEHELREITREYAEIAERARAMLHKGKSDTGTPAVKGRKARSK